MIEEFYRLNGLYDYVGINGNNIWDYLIYLIQLFVTAYVGKIYLVHLFASSKSFMNLQAIMIAILLVGICYKIPNSLVDINEVLYWLKSSNLMALFTGIFLSFTIMASSLNFKSEFISSLLLLVSTLLILPSINGVSWGGELAYFSVLGKCLGVFMFHNTLNKIVR